MKRREFITLASGAAAWPVVGRAQQPGGMRRIGVLTTLAGDDPESQARLAGFRQRLEMLGWLEGRNVLFDIRFTAANADRFQTLAKDIVTLQPDVILASGTPLVAALQRETSTIPIVFVGVSDPVGSGFIASLARPGGNLTGFINYEASIAGKWLQMLREIAPRLARAAFIGNPRTGAYDYFIRAAEALAPKLVIELVPSPVETAADIDRAIEVFALAPEGGLILPPNTTTNVHRDRVIALAAHHRLPAVYAYRYFVTAGGLMSYGVDSVDQYRRSADYIDRILRGAKPADLPAQTPVKYETVVNLKTAAMLGLTFSPGLLLAADEVIE